MSVQSAFFKDREIVARIAGIEMPQRIERNAWTQRDVSEKPAEMAQHWAGRMQEVSPDGHVLGEKPIQRIYESASSRFSFREITDQNESVQLSAECFRNRLLVCGRIGNHTVHGLGKDYAHFTEFELCLANGTIVEWMEVAKVRQHRLVSVRRWWIEGVLTRIEVVNVSPRFAPEYPEWIGCVGAPR